MQGEAALVLVSIGLFATGCKTYIAIPFDAGDASADSFSGPSGDTGADDGPSDQIQIVDRFSADAAPDPQPDGKPCASNDDCESKACVDNVCCESSCVGLCLACSIQKTGVASGRCSTITGGTDPDSECSEDLINPCGQDGTCGSGICRLRVQGTACGTATCGGSTFRAADACNGAGSCVAANSVPCPGNFACTSASTCGTSCTSRSTTGCAAGFECINSACVQATVGCRGVNCPVGTGGQCCWTPPDFPGTATCLGPGASCQNGSSVFCDSKADCPLGQICCAVGTGDVVGQWSISCMPAADCHNQQGDVVFGEQVCDPALVPTECSGTVPCSPSFFSAVYSAC
jgi:hypothetical protein